MEIKFEIRNLSKNNEIVMKGESDNLIETIENLNLIVENSIKDYEGLTMGGHRMSMGNQHVITLVGSYKGIKQYKGYEAIIKYYKEN